MKEVHCTNKSAKLWQQESGYKWNTSSGNSSACGCVIMTNSKVKVEKSFNNHDGRYVIVNINLDEKNTHYVTFMLQTTMIPSSSEAYLKFWIKWPQRTLF